MLDHLAVQCTDVGVAAAFFDTVLAPLGGSHPSSYGAFVRDPDGYRIELVQWPRGHADGITEADFP